MIRDISKQEAESVRVPIPEIATKERKTDGVGPDLNKVSPKKRTKAAWHKVLAAKNVISLKAWAKQEKENEDVKIWLKNKKLAKKSKKK